jgi:hypothetical protein
VFLKFVTSFNRHSGQAGDDPESRKIKGFWIPASAGMTDLDSGTTNFDSRTLELGWSIVAASGSPFQI